MGLEEHHQQGLEAPGLHWMGLEELLDYVRWGYKSSWIKSDGVKRAPEVHQIGLEELLDYIG